jgi:heptosyltransferase-2
MQAPILIIPYMWIGDFVRCHTAVKLLREREPARPIDVLANSNAAPLLDYMPGVRKGIVVDLPRKQLAFAQHQALGKRLRAEGYAQVLVMPRTWKSALAPYLAGIPRRTGFFGEARIGLINDLRAGERRLFRMVDRCASLALRRREARPASWPQPELVVPTSEVLAWRHRFGLNNDGRPVVALAAGAVGPSKRWPESSYRELAARLVAQGCAIWIVGSQQEKGIADNIGGRASRQIDDLTGPDLRNAILALKAADAAVSNDSGLLHVAAALGTPSVGIFGPTSAWHWAPLNPLAAVMETAGELPCRPCHKPVCRVGHHRCMHDISMAGVALAVTRILKSTTPQQMLAAP